MIFRKAVLFLALICLFSSPGCDPWDSDPLDFIHSITVTNATDCSLVVILDASEYLELPDRNNYGVFDDVSEGAHRLTAYRFEFGDPGEEVATVDIVVSERKDYYWSITGCTP